METHSTVLAWKIRWTEEPGGYSPRGRKELDVTEQLSTAQHSLFLSLKILFVRTSNYTVIKYKVKLDHK